MPTDSNSCKHLITTCLNIIMDYIFVLSLCYIKYLNCSYSLWQHLSINCISLCSGRFTSWSLTRSPKRAAPPRSSAPSPSCSTTTTTTSSSKSIATWWSRPAAVYESVQGTAWKKMCKGWFIFPDAAETWTVWMMKDQQISSSRSEWSRFSELKFTDFSFVSVSAFSETLWLHKNMLKTIDSRRTITLQKWHKCTLALNIV